MLKWRTQPHFIVTTTAHVLKMVGFQTMSRGRQSNFPGPKVTTTIPNSTFNYNFQQTFSLVRSNLWNKYKSLKQRNLQALYTLLIRMIEKIFQNGPIRQMLVPNSTPLTGQWFTKLLSRQRYRNKIIKSQNLKIPKFHVLLLSLKPPNRTSRTGKKRCSYTTSTDNTMTILRTFLPNSSQCGTALLGE